MVSGGVAGEDSLTHISPSYRCSSGSGGNDCTTGAGGLGCNGVGCLGNDEGPWLLILQSCGWLCFELSSPKYVALCLFCLTKHYVCFLG